MNSKEKYYEEVFCESANITLGKCYDYIKDLETENKELKKLNAKYYDDLRNLVLMIRKICYCGCGAYACNDFCDSKIEFDEFMNKFKDII